MTTESTVEVLRGIVAQLDQDIARLRRIAHQANPLESKRFQNEINGIEYARDRVAEELARLQRK